MSQPISLGIILSNILKNIKIDEKLSEQEIIVYWSKFVDESIQKHTKPFDIKDGVLSVNVDSNIWAQEFNFRKSQIKNQINTKYGSSVVKDIKFICR